MNWNLSNAYAFVEIKLASTESRFRDRIVKYIVNDDESNIVYTHMRPRHMLH